MSLQSTSLCTRSAAAHALPPTLPIEALQIDDLHPRASRTPKRTNSRTVSAQPDPEKTFDASSAATSEFTLCGVTFTFRSNLKGYDRSALDCVRSVLPRDLAHIDETPSGRRRVYDMVVGGGDLQVTIDGERHRAPLTRAWDLIADDVKTTLARCSTSHAAFRAAAVWVEDEAILFVGRPGSGTSRLARAFDRMGYRILADELVLVDPDPPRVAGRRIGAVVDASYKPDAPLVIRESGNLLDRLVHEGASPQHLRIATEICLEARTLHMLRGEADVAARELLRVLRNPLRTPCS